MNDLEYVFNASGSVSIPSTDVDWYPPNTKVLFEMLRKFPTYRNDTEKCHSMLELLRECIKQTEKLSLCMIVRIDWPIEKGLLTVEFCGSDIALTPWLAELCQFSKETVVSGGGIRSKTLIRVILSIDIVDLINIQFDEYSNVISFKH